MVELGRIGMHEPTKIVTINHTIGRGALPILAQHMRKKGSKAISYNHTNRC